MANDFRTHIQGGGCVVFEFPAACRLPAALGLWLLSLLNQLAALGRGRIELEFEAGGELFGYLDRNGFFQFLSSDIVTSPERPLLPGALLHQGMAGTLVEIAPIHATMSLDDEQETLRKLTQKLQSLYSDTPTSRSLANNVRTALAELVQNVRTHSRTTLQGFAVLQAYTNSPTPRVQIGVSDSGVGIPASLREGLGRKLRPESDAQLILRTFRQGLSSTGDQGRGCGLHKCALLALKYGTSVSVRTPSAHVTLRPSADNPKVLEAELREGVRPFDGTHLCLEFRLDR